jgi:recombination associated protein RdgC
MKTFKNAVIYRLTRNVLNLETLQSQLEANLFKPCGTHDFSSMGWVSPISGDSHSLAHIANGQILLTAKREEKILPSAVVKKHLEEKINKLEVEQQQKLERAEKKALKEEVIQLLLPRAFTRESLTSIWINPKKSLIIVDAPSAIKAEEALALLRKSLGSLPILPLEFKNPVETTLTEWVRHGSPIVNLSLLNSAEFEDINEAGCIVQCKNQALNSEEILAHIDAGKIARRVALNWQDRIEFTLTEKSMLKRIRFSEKYAEINDHLEDAKARFDADFVLLTGDLELLIDELIVALGG